MKKIIFVAQSLRRGGAERVVSLLSQEFERIGYDVKIILFQNEIEYEFGGEIIDISTPASNNYFVKIIRLLQRVKRLKKIFKKEKPDYIFSFMESCNFASILTGENVIVSIHNNPLQKQNWYQKFLIKQLYKFSNVLKVITVSRGIERILNEYFNIKNTKTIYNPVYFKEQSGNNGLLKYNNFILSVGRLHYQKNYELLILAFSKTKTLNYTSLLIAGEGNMRKELEKLIKNLKLEDKVILLGQVDNVSDYYINANLYILSSRFEGFGNVIAEALYFELPVIATDCPFGPKEIIKNGENGLLVENENQEALTKAIDKLYFNDELKKKLRNNAKKSIEHLKLENIAKEWLKLR